jgi:hypothetical protein
VVVCGWQVAEGAANLLDLRGKGAKAQAKDLPGSGSQSLMSAPRLDGRSEKEAR